MRYPKLPIAILYVNLYMLGGRIEMSLPSGVVGAAPRHSAKPLYIYRNWVAFSWRDRSNKHSLAKTPGKEQKV